MTVDEVLDERAVGEDRQPLCSWGVQCGFNEHRSPALTISRGVDLGVDEGDDAGPAPILASPPRSGCRRRRGFPPTVPLIAGAASRTASKKSMPKSSSGHARRHMSHPPQKRSVGGGVATPKSQRATRRRCQAFSWCSSKSHWTRHRPGDAFGEREGHGSRCRVGRIGCRGQDPRRKHRRRV
jgi:hypothetical protein